MKSNKIPAHIRIQMRIFALECKIDKWVKIGRGNPYQKCYYCGRSQPDVSNNGHYKGCPEPGFHKEIKYYKNLLSELEEQ